MDLIGFESGNGATNGVCSFLKHSQTFRLFAQTFHPASIRPYVPTVFSSYHLPLFEGRRKEQRPGMVHGFSFLSCVL